MAEKSTPTSKVEVYVYEHFGDQTVNTAAQLIGKLPNGWQLNNLTYSTEFGVGSWTAVVESPKQENV